MRQIFDHFQGRICCWGKRALFQVHGKKAHCTDGGQIEEQEGEGQSQLLLGSELAGARPCCPCRSRSSCQPSVQDAPFTLLPFFKTKVLKEEIPAKPPTNPQRWMGGCCWGWPRPLAAPCVHRIALGTGRTGSWAGWAVVPGGSEVFITAELNGKFLSDPR